jgi:hypothetical protein
VAILNLTAPRFASVRNGTLLVNGSATAFTGDVINLTLSPGTYHLVLENGSTVLNSLNVTLTAGEYLALSLTSSISATISATPAVSIDLGQGVTFTAHASGGQGTLSYAWTIGLGCSNSGGASDACTPSTSGTVDVTVLVSDSYGDSGTASYPFTVYPDPTASTPTPSRTSADVGQSVTFSTTAASGSGGYAYAWANLPAGCAGTTASIACTVTTAQSVATRVTVTDSDGFSVTSGSLAFTVDSDPTVTAPTPSRGSADLGQSVTFSVTGVGGSGGFTYAWSGLPTGCSSSNTASLACTATASGTFSSVAATVTDSNGGANTSAPLSFTVFADPSVTTPTASRGSADVGQSVTFSASASSGSGGYSYAWSGLPTGCSSSSAATLTCTVTAAGSFPAISVNVTDSNGIRAASGALRFTVFGDPTTTTPTPSRSSLDVGQNVTFSTTASYGSGGYSYAWSGLPTGCSSSNTPSLGCTPSGSGSFRVTVTVTDSNGGTGGSAGTLSLTVYADPTAATPTANRTSADVGQSVGFSSSTSGGPGAGGNTYAWSGLPSGCSGTGTLSVTCNDLGNAGTFSVTVSVTDADGYSARSLPLNFTVSDDPSIATPGANRTSADVGQSVTLTTSASLGSGGYSYGWAGLPSGCSGSTSSVTCTVLAAGTFSIRASVTDSNGVVAWSGALGFTVYPDPTVAPPSSSAPSADVGQNVTFTTTVSPGSGGDTFRWVLPTGCAGNASSVTCNSLASPGTYTVEVVVTDSNGASVTSVAIAFRVFADPVVTAPQASVASADVGQNATFSAAASSGSPGYSYAWYGLPGACARTGATVFCPDLATPGSYAITVVVTDANGFAVTSTALDFTVYDRPTVADPTPDRTRADVGQNWTFALDVTGVGAGGDVLGWASKGDPGLRCTLASPSTLVCTSDAPGVFLVLVVVTDHNGGASSALSASVTVLSDPSVTTPSLTRNVTDVGLPLGASVTAIGGSGEYTYDWLGLPAGCGGDGATILCAPASPETFRITVTVTDSNGFAVASESTLLTVNAAVTASSIVGPSGTTDPGRNLTFAVTAGGGSGPVTDTWLFGDGTRGSGSPVSHAYARPGQYVVWVWVNDSAGASVARSFVVTVAVAPGASRTGLGLSTLDGEAALGGVAAAAAVAGLLWGTRPKRGARSPARTASRASPPMAGKPAGPR